YLNFDLARLTDGWVCLQAPADGPVLLHHTGVATAAIIEWPSAAGAATAAMAYWQVSGPQFSAMAAQMPTVRDGTCTVRRRSEIAFLGGIGGKAESARRVQRIEI